MPLGRQLNKLFNPGPAKSYDPNREALFAQLLASGVAPTNDVGSAIGNLAQMFVGQRGLKKQGQAYKSEMDQQAAMEAENQARQSQALAATMAGLGIEGDPNVLTQNPALMAEAIAQGQPPAPQAAPVSPDASKAVYLTNPDTGETRPVFDQNDMQAAWSEGFRRRVEEPEAKMSRLADGYTYWTTGPEKGQRVNPDVIAAASGPQTVVNVTNQPDIEKSTKGQLEKKLIQSRESLDRMDQIVSEFKPEYLTIGDKIETSLLGWQEKAGMTLDPSQKEALAARATFFQKTYDSVNRTIRDMTGAQMNEHEAGRLMKGMPNQDDSPTEFMAKMQSVIGQIKSYDRIYRETMGQGLGPAEEAAPPAGASPIESMSDEDLKKALGL